MKLEKYERYMQIAGDNAANRAFLQPCEYPMPDFMWQAFGNLLRMTKGAMNASL